MSKYISICHHYTEIIPEIFASMYNVLVFRHLENDQFTICVMVGWSWSQILALNSSPGRHGHGGNASGGDLRPTARALGHTPPEDEESRTVTISCDGGRLCRSHIIVRNSRPLSHPETPKFTPHRQPLMYTPCLKKDFCFQTYSFGKCFYKITLSKAKLIKLNPQ